MKNLLSFILLLCCTQVWGQLQTCPTNINFSDGNFTHWFGYTGVFEKKTVRQPLATINYDSISYFPLGTLYAMTIPEYRMSSNGIEVLTSNSNDYFGNFETIPTINGYSYNYSMKIGSTTVNTGGSDGGLFRGLGYTINVPAGPVTDPYVITYAYAMVLENASHTSYEMPMFTATLTTSTGTKECANAMYFLPTKQSGSGFVIDQQLALQKGFELSGKPSPNDLSATNPNDNLYRVWTKGWTEVIVDLAAWRGQQVTLTFEADNCVPSGHFAYAYVALKSICAGLEISGNTKACTNGNLTYTIPELTGATYQWTIPNGWQTVKDSFNTITVIPDANAGTIVARATNSCADLKANINVTITPPTIPGTIKGDTTVCFGLNPNQSFPVILIGNRGKVLNWISSNDNGNYWNNINDTSTVLNVKNISSSTIYKAIIQNGAACRIDSTNTAKITLNYKPVAGTISPDSIQVCLDQSMANALTLNGSSGKIYNWQSSMDLINWTTISASTTDTVQGINNVQGKTYFRAIVTNLGCPSDTSNRVNIGVYNVHFPKATIFPKDTTICFGTIAQLTALIQTGTNYQWLNPSSIYNGGSGIVSGTPFLIQARTAPSKKTDYIIRIFNAGCPNYLYDTIHINVSSPLSINAGRDTTVLIDQPLQLKAFPSDGRQATYLWTPSTGLSSTIIDNPIATLDGSLDFIKYTVAIIDSLGCSATDNLLVTLNRNGPEIFMPTGFTPNADGKNDLLKPTVKGITQQFYFSVYNRWGQQVFFTNEIGRGWDGTWNGTMQPSGAYVFVTEGADYLGHKISRKGTAVLIR
ncbi:MAG: gliding motility-associated C-terminal domain-containing protein [Bacteroidota bacterium]